MDIKTRIFLKENEQTTAQIEDQVRVAMKIPPRGKAEDKVGDETITGTTNKVSVDNNKKIKSSEQELSSVT